MNVRGLIKSFLIYGLTSGISRFIPLLLIPLYIRVFSVSENGIIDMIQTMNQFLLIFGILQLETSIQRYYYELETEERTKMISTVIIFVFLISMLIALLLFLFSVLISEVVFNGMNYSLEISISACIIPFLNVSILNFIILRYQKKSWIFSAITLLQVLLTASLTLFFVFKLHLGIKSVFLGHLMGYFIIVVVQLFFIRKEIKWCFDISVLKKMLSYSTPQLPARIGSESISRLNRFILITFLSTASLGTYAIAVKFASAIELVNVAFSMAWIPYAYESLKTEGYKEKFREIFLYVIHCVFFIIILLSLFTTEITIMFATPDYYQIKYIMPGLFLSYGLYVIRGMVEIGISISKKTIFLTYIYLSTALLNVLFLLIGVKLFEIKGIVYVSVITNFCLVLFTWYVAEKLHPIGFDVKQLIVSFISVFCMITFLMNIELFWVYRILLAFLLCGLLFHYLYKKKERWRRTFLN